MSRPNQDEIHTDESKDIAVHDEAYQADAAAHKTESYQLKSEFDILTVRQVLWKFRKPISFAVVVGLGALAEGYAGMING